MGKGKFGVALIQHDVYEDKEKTVEHVIDMIKDAYKKYKPKFVCLPENFNSPFGEHYFETYAEVVPGGYTSTRLSATAKELKIYIISSYPERDQKNPKVLYNCATAFGPDGTLLAKYRKVHLCDIDIAGVHTFNESKAMTPGTEATIFEAEGLKFGITICHDIYYEEFWKVYRRKGVDMMFWPAAFHENMAHHWDFMVRARANDNQFYLAAMSATYDKNAYFPSWGKSFLVDPWGRVLSQGGQTEEIVYAEVDFDKIETMRNQLPSWKKRNPELYEKMANA